MTSLCCHYGPGSTPEEVLLRLLDCRSPPIHLAPFFSYLHGPRLLTSKPLHVGEVRRLLTRVPRPFARGEVVALPLALKEIVRPRKVTASLVLPDDTGLTQARKAMAANILEQNKQLRVHELKLLACRRAGRADEVDLVKASVHEEVFVVQAERRKQRLFATERSMQSYIDRLEQAKIPYKQGVLTWTISNHHGGFEWKGVAQLRVATPFRRLCGFLLLTEPTSLKHGVPLDTIFEELEQLRRSHEKKSPSGRTAPA